MIFPQKLICAFALDVRFAFEAYLNEKESARTLMNATKGAQYLYLFANRE